MDEPTNLFRGFIFALPIGCAMWLVAFAIFIALMLRG